MSVCVYHRITDLLLPLQYWIHVSIIIPRSVCHHKGLLLSSDEFSTDIILFHIFSSGRYSCLLSSYHLSSLLSSVFRVLLCSLLLCRLLLCRLLLFKFLNRFLLFRLLNRVLLFRLLNRLNLNWFTLCRLLLCRFPLYRFPLSRSRSSWLGGILQLHWCVVVVMNVLKIHNICTKNY